MARTALNAFFAASLLCGLAILSCAYLVDVEVVPPLVHLGGRRLMQVPASPSAPKTSSPAAPPASPSAPLRPLSPAAPPADASPAATTAAEPAVPAEPAELAADPSATPDPTADDLAVDDVADQSDALFNGTDPAPPPADDTPDHWQFPWKKFWLWTGFLCAGTGACGLVSGLVLGTLQGFGACQTCEACNPETRPAGTSYSGGGYSGSYSSSGSGPGPECCRGEMAVCGCLVGLVLLALGAYLLMPMMAACLGYGSGYVVGAALSTALVLACPCTEGCRARRDEWKEAWAARAAAARARAGLPPTTAPAAFVGPALELPSAKVTSDAADAGCKAGADHDMHSVDLEATVAPRQQPGFELY